ncbi:MAG: glutamate racemase [Parasporobacterium sp.]|nr:glutamate racemase [Parasporobacterium sp.]
MDLRNLPIGVFDSGVGGLTVAREIFRNLPNEKIIYYGDTARVPYGNKSRETIIRYSRQITQFLLSKNVKAIVIACNTATSLAIDAVKEMTDLPVIGVIEPGARAAVSATASGRIGIIGTSATVTSGLYEKCIRDLLPDARVFSKACPLFVHLVEEGMIDDSVTVEMIHRYLDDMIESDRIDTLILGCTHYPLLRSVIAREIGGTYADYPVSDLDADVDGDRNESRDADADGDGSRDPNGGGKAAAGTGAGKIQLVNPAYTTAMELARLLAERGMATDIPAAPSDHQFYSSDSPDSFRSFASRILGLQIDKVSLKILD